MLGFRLAVVLIACAACSDAGAQSTIDLGLPPPSGFQNPVLPPPSGSQNPVLPPPSGQRYTPGVGGRFGGSSDIPGIGERGVSPVAPLAPRAGSGEMGIVGDITPATQPFQGEASARLSDIAPSLRRCWTPPAGEGSETDGTATVRFSLRRDGSLFGQPRVSWKTRALDPISRQRFADSVVSAVRDCTPMRLSPRLGAAIAGRPLSIRFHGRAPSNERPT